MTAPISRVRVDTVAARQSPARKGVGRPLITPVTRMEGADGLLRGETTAGLTPASTWAVIVQVEDAEGRVGVGTAGLGHPSTVAAVEQLAPVLVGREPTDVELLWETMYRSTLNVGRRGVVLHVPHVGAAHNLHLSISSHATPLLEFMPPPAPGTDPDEDQLFWSLFPDEPRPAGGRIAPTGRPGLGVTLDESLLDR